ncbi:MAG: Gfo/Idh/MocA family oxidoreductase [Anaerolineae bacterium]|nr:Gfo/Idh/MocA family oxidoreductase [Anaerolineae bacterium]
MGSPVTAILIGAGDRGMNAYGAHALARPDQLQFVAVAEPNEARRARFAAAHGIDARRQFATWEELLAKARMAEAAVICTPDRAHAAPALAALAAGYDVLLEKPLAATLPDCVRLAQAAAHAGRMLQVCHVLRYTPFFSTVHAILEAGRLGEVVTVAHRENVSYWHMAHSYVRGHWRNSALSSPMILAKCCHDLDLLYWYLGPCARLSSVGGLRHFRPENAPPGAPARCTDGCPHSETCPWYAPRLYIDLAPLIHMARSSNRVHERLGAWLALERPRLTRALRRLFPRVDAMLDYRGPPVSTISEDTSIAGRWRALETGPYGRCVYHCDNDVVDHQVVDMQFESGVSAALVMHGHSHEEGRTLRIDGTRATLLGRFTVYRQEIEIHDHGTQAVERIDLRRKAIDPSGHGGGDAGLLAAFVQAVRSGVPGATSAHAALESHLMAFAAEEARVSGSTIDMDAYRERALRGAQAENREESR